MSDLEISTDPSQKGNANLIYILYLVGLAAGITAVVGLVMAYMAKDKGPEWLQSHYRNQINLFWKMIVYFIIGVVLTVIMIGFLVMLAATIWYIVRVIQGMQALNRNEAIANPSSWGL
ncbi:MAG: DUF4870 domain-containing protein [Parvularculaceae bacterium]